MSIPQFVRSSQFAVAVLIFSATATTAAAQTRLSVAPAVVRPGSIVRLTLTASAADPITSIRGEMAGEQLHFLSRDSGIWRAIGGIPVDARDSVAAHVIIERSSGSADTSRVWAKLPRPPRPRAGARRSRPRRLSVDSRFTRPLDAETRARIDRENARAREVGRRSHSTPHMWTTSFLRPRSSTVTSRFGTGRSFNGVVSSRHLGVDFRGGVGAPVVAANRGVVALVDRFFLAGNVVYVDHGGGIVTGYFHLSRTDISEGETVERGQQIGLVGATGRVTGPHLHWTARYGALTVNPLDLVAIQSGWYGGR
ncbi:MAG TPA: M23 family metallopeptidase [Gemmatimonadaceae bacterium]|nr:M23 family metallopeptidase [Gemmatimonadaceae bacterium]